MISKCEAFWRKHGNLNDISLNYFIRRTSKIFHVLKIISEIKGNPLNIKILPVQYGCYSFSETERQDARKTEQIHLPSSIQYNKTNCSKFGHRRCMATFRFVENSLLFYVLCYQIPFYTSVKVTCVTTSDRL